MLRVFSSKLSEMKDMKAFVCHVCLFISFINVSVGVFQLFFRNTFEILNSRNAESKNIYKKMN